MVIYREKNEITLASVNGNEFIYSAKVHYYGGKIHTDIDKLEPSTSVNIEFDSNVKLISSSNIQNKGSSSDAIKLLKKYDLHIDYEFSFTVSSDDNNNLKIMYAKVSD